MGNLSALRQMNAQPMKGEPSGETLNTHTHSYTSEL